MPTNPFLTVLLNKIRAGHAAAVPQADFLAAAEGAPEEAAELLRALAAVDLVNVPLGWRSIWDPGLGRLAGGLEMAEIDEDHPGWFDASKSVELGASAGGEVQFGFHWTNGKFAFVEIDPDVQTVTRFATAEALFEHMRADEARRGPVPDDLLAIFAAAGKPIAVPPPPPLPCPRLEPWTGAPLPDPIAEARRALGQKELLLQSEPTPRGRRVVAQRLLRSTPRPTRLVVVEPDGTARPLDWDPAADIYGLCAVPGQERVLLATGVPGPLLEIDLDSGARRELVDAVRFHPCFVDDAHLVVLTGQDEVRVYAYRADGPLGDPVATAAVPGFNLFAAGGHVFLKGKQKDLFHVLRWTGSALAPRADCPAVSKKPVNYLNAGRTADGALALCFVETDGKVNWFRYLPED